MNELKTLAQYLAGEFSNQEQALSQPAWYVNLRLWLRPVNIFGDESITLFAEQANIVNINQPYRPRILRLKYSDNQPNNLIVEHYKFKEINQVKGGGSNRDILEKITLNHLEFLPNCTLKVETQKSENTANFKVLPISENPCSFSYENKEYQVKLGFEVNEKQLLTYDKGIDKNTGKAIWGALMGPYIYQKITDFSSEITT
jgi:CpeT/CpcT family (DUF1001)